MRPYHKSRGHAHTLYICLPLPHHQSVPESPEFCVSEFPNPHPLFLARNFGLARFGLDTRCGHSPRLAMSTRFTGSQTFVQDRSSNLSHLGSTVVTAASSARPTPAEPERNDASSTHSFRPSTSPHIR